MIDVNWNDNAKAAVKEFYRWANAMFKSGCSIDTNTFFKEFTETQTKTVADAVEYYGKTFVAGQWTHIRCGKDGKMLFASGETDSDNWQDSYLVCTREEFEAYVKEQEGEKWTHTYENIKCRIALPNKDKFGTIIVFSETGEYFTPREGDLKPIKPTISEAQAWRKAVLAGNMQHITDNYNVVAKD